MTTIMTLSDHKGKQWEQFLLFDLIWFANLIWFDLFSVSLFDQGLQQRATVPLAWAAVLLVLRVSQQKTPHCPLPAIQVRYHYTGASWLLSNLPSLLFFPSLSWACDHKGFAMVTPKCSISLSWWQDFHFPTLLLHSIPTHFLPTATGFVCFWILSVRVLMLQLERVNSIDLPPFSNL
jgi:hypothetical protein